MVLMLFLHCTDAVGQSVHLVGVAKLETCTFSTEHDILCNG